MVDPEKIKVTDVIARFFAEKGMRHVFGVSGGAVLHLLDSFVRDGRVTPVFSHHEQAAAFAAQSYARVAEVPGACVVTTGPGGSNALTGLLGAWLDSIPCVFISGQARLEHLSRPYGVRQRGVQEFDILSLVDHMTKKTYLVSSPESIHEVLHDAYETAVSGRPGPVWIDLPLNVQWSMVPAHAERAAIPGTSAAEAAVDMHAEVDALLAMLRESRRPLFLIGHGVRLGRAVPDMLALLDRLGVPSIATWNASDVIDTDRGDFVGRPGVFGQRGANLAMQNCDLLVAFGSHLAIPVIGTQFKTFAREARVVVVDLDRKEVQASGAHIDNLIACDVRRLLESLVQATREWGPMDIGPWRERCRDYKAHNAVTVRKPAAHVDPYVFVDRLSEMMRGDEVIVVDGGGTCNQIGFQSLRTRTGQRLVISGALCAMGSGLPESVGAAFARPGKNIVCFCGDGSFQFNVQELQTIVHHRLPVKVFVFCNKGYLSIRQTQDAFFESRYSGSAESGGLSVPDVARIAEAYGVSTFRIESSDDLESVVPRMLAHVGPALCTLAIPENSPVEPHVSFVRNADGTMSPRPLEDMAPFLDRDEFNRLMVVRPLA